MTTRTIPLAPVKRVIREDAHLPDSAIDFSDQPDVSAFLAGRRTERPQHVSGPREASRAEPREGSGARLTTTPEKQVR
jgi:hypothetical protein